MKDITAEVHKNALLYVWDSTYQASENDEIGFIESFKKFKSLADKVLEDHAHIVDITDMSKKDVNKVLREYKKTYYVTQLNNLYSTRNPDYRKYDDLYFSEQTPIFISKEAHPIPHLLNIELYRDKLETTFLERAAVISSDCKNLYDIISRRLGMNAYKDPHPLMHHIQRLSKGYKLHIYTPADNMRYFIKDIAVIQKFYKEVPELNILSYYPF